MLHRALVGDDLVANSGRPQASLGEVSEKVLVHHGELSSQHPSVVHIAVIQNGVMPLKKKTGIKRNCQVIRERCGTVVQHRSGKSEAIVAT